MSTAGDCGLLCGMGPSTEGSSFGRGTVANFMNRETVRRQVEPSDSEGGFSSDLGSSGMTPGYN